MIRHFYRRSNTVFMHPWLSILTVCRIFMSRIFSALSYAVEHRLSTHYFRAFDCISEVLLSENKAVEDETHSWHICRTLQGGGRAVCDHV